MKKLLSCLFVVFVMAGCGSSTPKTVTCTGNVAGDEIKSVLNAKGDKLVSEEMITTADIESFGIDAATLTDEDKASMIQEMEEASGMKGIKGISLDVTLDGSIITMKSISNYEETEMVELQKAGIVEAGIGSSISLETTIENYETQGLSCN